MASLRLSALLISVALAGGACDRRPDTAQATITVKLPPAQPHTPTPAFSFKPSGKRPTS